MDADILQPKLSEVHQMRPCQQEICHVWIRAAHAMSSLHVNRVGEGILCSHK